MHLNLTIMFLTNFDRIRNNCFGCVFKFIIPTKADQSRAEFVMLICCCGHLPSWHVPFVPAGVAAVCGLQGL